MTTKRQKIYLLIASQPATFRRDDWLSTMPELSIVADIEPIFISKNSSADITPEVWVKMAKEIYKRINKASGFVIFHGIDNLLYTSCALSFLLQNLTKPIIFTGGQQGSFESNKMEIRANLINASQTASHSLDEVSLMFGNLLLRAVQASRSTEESLNLFVTPLDGILGRIDFSIRMSEKAVLKRKGKTKLFNELNGNIEVINLSPFIDLKILPRRLADKKGVVINADIYQDIPTKLMSILQKNVSNIPVIIWSRKIKAQTLTPKNIILIDNMTWEATVTKFMWALTQSKSIKKTRELMNKDIAGEVLD